MSSEPEVPAVSSIRRAAQTYLGKLLVLGGALMASILTARALGPEGRGVLALSISITSLSTFVLTAGMSSANQLLAARHPDQMRTLLRQSVQLAAVIGLLCLLVAVSRLGRLSLLPEPVFYVTLGAIAINSMYVLLHGLLAGLGRLNLLSFTDLIASAGLALLLLMSAPQTTLTPLAVVWMRLALNLAGVALLARGLLPFLQRRGATQPPLLRESVALGASFFAASVLALMLREFDVLLVSYFLGETATGLYAVASTLITLQYVLPESIILVIYPRLVTRTTFRERWLAGRRPIFASGLLLFLTCAGTGLLGPFLISVLFGSKFAGSISPMLWALPGAWCMAVQRVCSTLFGASGVPKSYIVVNAVCVAASIGLNLYLIPRHQLVGAAQAASLTNALYFALTVALIVRRLRSEESGG